MSTYLRAWLHGLYDGIAIWRVYPHLCNSKVRAPLLRVLYLNAVIFGGTILFYKLLVLPFMRLLIQDTYWVEKGFEVFWCWPVYLLLTTLNSFSYNEIVPYMWHIPQRISPSFEFPQFIRYLSEEVFRSFLVILMTLLTPLLNLWWWPLGDVYLCFLTAIYIMDHVYSKARMKFPERIWQLETHAMYYLGFGTWATLPLLCMPKFLGLAYFASFLPLSLLLTRVPKPAYVPFLQPFIWVGKQIIVLYAKIKM
jgi:hypothetical protein